MPSGGSLEDSVTMLALLLNGDAERDGQVILDFCKTTGVSPHVAYREIFSRCLFPTEWTLH